MAIAENEMYAGSSGELHGQNMKHDMETAEQCDKGRL